ncbi:unnamed protein product, partial [Urochloa humidicola]
LVSSTFSYQQHQVTNRMEELLTLLFNALLLVFMVKLVLALFHTKLIVILFYIAVLLFAMALSGRFPG